MIILMIGLLLSFAITYISMPYAIDKLKSNGHVVLDLYKFDKPRVPTHGAVVVFFVVFLICALLPLLISLLKRFQIDYEFGISEIDIAILLVISAYGLFGTIDDLIHIPWGPKLFFPICFSFPLLVVFSPTSLIVPFYGEFELDQIFIENIEYSDIFKVIVIPIYVMVVANLINMHSGFNGLQSGLSCIIITTVVIKSLIDGNNNNLIIAVVFLGGMLAFLYYNKYPSKIIEGNIGPLVFGACIGTLIIIKSLYFFGVFILLPHIADFLLWLYELIIIKKEFTKVKFGSLREDGTIEAPTPFKMKFLFPYYFRLKENQVVWILHSLTGVFCVLGLIIF